MLDGHDDEGSVTVQGYEALYAALRTAAAHARTLPNRVADAFRRETAEMPRSTEAERVVVQRVGQSLFRAALIDYWQGRCCVTGLDVQELLRASHIKPWAVCDSDDERLDVFNGLLLSPQLDALFDGGWITFDDEGCAVISPGLTELSRVQLDVHADWRIGQLTVAHRRYLDFHRIQQYLRA
jgi:predicted restriction endonuclease